MKYLSDSLYQLYRRIRGDKESLLNAGDSSTTITSDEITIHFDRVRHDDPSEGSMPKAQKTRRSRPTFTIESDSDTDSDSDPPPDTANTPNYAETASGHHSSRMAQLCARLAGKQSA